MNQLKEEMGIPDWDYNSNVVVKRLFKPRNEICLGCTIQGNTSKCKCEFVQFSNAAHGCFIDYLCKPCARKKILQINKGE
ncbi:hypothetical protein CMI42_03280 [Candidatus Pacearchaeota archaeon]|nr:hypothetical protein [Candidatus Pacearchaeota archaeon]|tara:strand:- start:529 stop:768 length:240 start_codon:yes stop_codon:yes gene_type:complete